MIIAKINRILRPIRELKKGKPPQKTEQSGLFHQSCKKYAILYVIQVTDRKINYWYLHVPELSLLSLCITKNQCNRDGMVRTIRAYGRRFKFKNVARIDVFIQLVGVWSIRMKIGFLAVTSSYALFSL